MKAYCNECGNPNGEHPHMSLDRWNSLHPRRRWEGVHPDNRRYGWQDRPRDMPGWME